MYGLKELLNKEEERLLRIKAVVDKQLDEAPEGRLRISSSGKLVQYMHCTDENKKSIYQGNYIKKENAEFIKALAQKGYDKKVKRLVDLRLKQIQKINADYDDHEIEKIYACMNPTRKKLVRAYEIPFEQRISEWKKIEYNGKSFSEDSPEICTRKGERVRSKSEKIIADTFFERGIEYKYECPLELKGYGIIFPDFTIISRRTGKEVYWEHDGRMDDPQYAETAVRKIDTYIRNGIVPGDRLIVTFETGNYVLSDNTIDAMIKKYL